MQPPGPATVIVSAVVDTVGAVGSSLQLAAEARTAAGTVVTGATFTWSSSVTGTASVSNSGVVTFQSPGSVLITATTGTASGSIRMRGAMTDLSGVQFMLSDAYATSLVTGLDTPRATVTAANAACELAMSSGALSRVRDCLATLLGVSAGTTGSNAAILATLELFWQHAQRLLNFAG